MKKSGNWFDLEEWALISTQFVIIIIIIIIIKVKN